jgi:alkanesulfonate monooxygenase SsuD/methylene tetrahydromethanopterin reductase-like flavin-dependent oxidoreductase (luciferase family)
VFAEKSDRRHEWRSSMTARRHLHLNLNILNSGFYGSAWRAPESEPGAAFDVQHYVRNAQIAERGGFDAIFLADTPALKTIRPIGPIRRSSRPSSSPPSPP